MSKAASWWTCANSINPLAYFTSIIILVKYPEAFMLGAPFATRLNLPSTQAVVQTKRNLQGSPAMPPTVLVVGSLHHDIMIDAPGLPRRDETMVGTAWSPKFGGKGGNQAVAAARLAACRMLGAVGADGFGNYMRLGLTLGGVQDDFVQTTVDAPTGISVAIVDPAGDYGAVIVSGANLAIDPAPLADDALWADVAMLLLQNEVPEALNLAAAKAARQRGIAVMLNAAPARPLSADFAALIDVLVVNAVEAEMMGTAPVTDLATAAKAAETLAARFAAVVVTAGGAGLAAWSALDEAFRVPAEPVTVQSTHGAGDVFTGTLAAGLAEGAKLQTACKTASKAAAVHVSGTGASGVI
jgi:ribokinase